MGFWDKVKSVFKKKKQVPPPVKETPVQVSEKGSPQKPNFEYLAKHVFIDPGCEAALDKICEKIEAAKNTYLLPVQNATGAPWEWLGACFYREASLNFFKGLHCGQPWNKKTTLVPKGRGPFDSWHDAAVDALTVKGWVNPHGGLWTFAQCLERGERFNGLGYRSKGIYSSYVFGWTNFSEEKGRYVADHVFDPNSPERRPGVAAIMLRLQQRAISKP